MAMTIDGTAGITFPAGGTGNPAGTVVGTTDTQTLTNKTVGSGYGGSTIVAATAQNSTSGTNVDFTGIPSWVKRITVMFSGVSTNGSSLIQIQIGAGSITTSGYSSRAAWNGSTNVAGSGSMTSGFAIDAGGGAAWIRYGSCRIETLGGNLWVASHSMGVDSSGASYFLGGGGNVALSGTLDRLRITTVNGTDTFDAGSINILYE